MGETLATFVRNHMFVIWYCPVVADRTLNVHDSQTSYTYNTFLAVLCYACGHYNTAMAEACVDVQHDDTTRCSGCWVSSEDPGFLTIMRL